MKLNNTFAYILTFGLLMMGGAVMGQHVTVNGSVFGGGNLANVKGSSTVTIDQASAEIGNDVYGGGAKALVNVTTVGDVHSHTANTFTSVTLTQGKVSGNVYGGGLGVRPADSEDPGTPADVYGPVTVTINGGTVTGSVFGCNNEFGAPKRTVTVNVTDGTISTDVYGGGNLASYESTAVENSGIPAVNVSGGTVEGNVFGGGNGNVANSISANVAGGNVIVSGGSIGTGIYGGCNAKGTVTGDILVNVSGGQIGTDAEHTANIHGGGFGNNTSTNGNVTVNFGTTGDTHTSTPTLYGDVYGGSGFGNVNGSASNTTTVNIVNGEINGDVYGGGLGQKSDDPDLNYEALVKGVVTVNIGSLTGALDDNGFAPSASVSGNATIGGSVFGCNNTNGTPKDDVTVNVYKTARTQAQETGGTGYAISSVFGGGNEAHYQPISSGKKATVHVWTCDNTIQYVYGGGNAANVGTDGDGNIKSATDVIIDGGRIEWVFGGGNGAGLPAQHPGANIYGNVNVTYHAGNLTYLFGGSNEKGNISGDKTVAILADGECPTKYIAELYGGSNKAPINGNVELTMGCQIGMDESFKIGSLFGGSLQANISGNVTLNVEGGKYDYVFGGNNEDGTISGNVTLNLKGGTINEAAFGGNKGGGSINGNITVNVEDANNSCPLIVKDVFGAGDQAMYTAPTGEGAQANNPIVYVKHLRAGQTISGNVYGGGNGDPDDDSQEPGMVTGNPKVVIGDMTEGYRAAISGNVYGGGNAAKVDGTTTVLMQKDNSTVAQNIYGGGNLANVTGATDVDINGGTVSLDVYGGGALANTGGSNVTLGGGTVQDIYGGGLGDGGHEAEVNGPVQVTVNSGEVRDVFGCNNANGAPKNTVKVYINNDVTRNVYGGGNLAGSLEGYDIDPQVFINHGTVGGSVFGAGNGDPSITSGETAVIKGNPQVTVGDTDSEHSAIVTGNVYGGGNAAKVSGNTQVIYNDNGTSTTVANLFGGGNAAGVTGTTDVDMILGNVISGIYGGCNTSGVVGGNITVDVTGGTIGVDGTPANVHGGGFGNGTSTSGNVDVTINGASAEIWGDVYGGSAKGHVNDAAADHTNVTLTNGTIHGDLYGGGLGDENHAAEVNGAVQVTVNGGVVRDVFGCNNANGAPKSTVQVYINNDVTRNVYGGGNLAGSLEGYDINPQVFINHGTVGGSVFGAGNGNPLITSGETAVIKGNPQVTVGDTDSEHSAIVTVNVYGGGNAAKVSGNTKVTYNDNGTSTTVVNLFGGGNAAGVTGTTDVDMILGNVTGGIYGGCNTKGTVGGNITVDVTGGTIGTNATTTANVHGGGYGNNTSTDGNVVVNIGAAPVAPATTPTGDAVIWGDVYGGSADGSVNSDGEDHTWVTLYAGTINGSLYGGGLGITNDDCNVNGAVKVTVNGGTVNTTTNTALTTGAVFGCNNAKGSPKNVVQVEINGTAPSSGSGNTKVYALQGVYGGGNLAAYLPTTPYASGDNVYPKVTVNGCASSIKDVYGGGNAAPVPNSKVVINGGDIKRVFAGGNGESGTPAHIGWKNTAANPNPETDSYGTGIASADIKGGSIEQVFGGSNANGKIRTSSALDVNKDGACPMIIGEVYGGGNLAVGNAGSISIGCTGDLVPGNTGQAANPSNIGTTLEGIGTVYGGANAADVSNSIYLQIKKGIVNKVFGGNNTSGAISGTIKVDINQESGCDWYVGEVYGGGNHADYNGTPDVNIINGTVSGNVYGGGNDITGDTPENPKGVAGSDVEMTGGQVLGSVYGGCNLNGTVTGDSQVKINGGTVGSSDQLEGEPNTVPSVFGGGLGQYTKVNGNVTVTVDKTGANETNIYGDVYGGSAKGSVNNEASDKTTVNIFNGTLYTKNETVGGFPVYYGGNVYGGGLGEKENVNGGTSNIEAKVFGTVEVNIGTGTVQTEGQYAGYTTTDNTGNATIGGNVYGCNNTNGSPQQSVTVNIFKTAHTTTDTYGYDPTQNENIPATYALKNVFGGGNAADFLVEGKTTTVNVYGCDNTIQRTFGGGNAAATKAVNTMIQGGHIDEAYGGGNGEVSEANVNGNVSLAIHGGVVDHTFAGSNQHGTITGTSSVTVDNTSPCENPDIDELFCGGNYADVVGNINAVITCASGMKVKSLYGGCKQADILDWPADDPRHGTGGNVHLTVKGGTYHYIYGGSQGTPDPNGISADIDGDVTLDIYGCTLDNEIFNDDKTPAIFGGSHINGSIGGKITVNIEEIVGEGYCGLDAKLADVYGGGNLAAYTAPNATPNYPEVNIKNAEVHDVYGGGLGESAEVTGNPKVTIGDVSDGHESYVAKVNGNVYGGGNAAQVTGSTTVLMQKANSSATNLFGGGNAADVTAATTVTVNNGIVNGGSEEDHNGIYGGCNTTGNVGGLITLNINGGTFGTNTTDKQVYVHGGGYGENTTTTGSVTVNIGNGSATPVIYGDVYGGSALGTVNNTRTANTVNSNATTQVNLIKGTINGSLYGGGLGNAYHAAMVYSPVQVTVTSGTVTGAVYGCNNVNGAPQSTVNVDINGTDQHASGYAIAKVFGGGNAAAYDYTPVVKVHNCDNKIEYVYGGGNAATVCGTDVTIYGGNTIGNVFGGCYGANVTQDGTDVKIHGGTIGAVYGGNNHSGAITGNIKVTVNKQTEAGHSSCPMHITDLYGGGNEAGSNAGAITIHCTGEGNDEGISNVYGGANKAAVTGPIVLTIDEGRIGNVFGGNNNSGTITGAITVNIEKKASPCVFDIGNVFGGGNLAQYSGNPAVNIKNGTVSGNVYGGGKGDPSDHTKGKVTGDPVVTIGDNSAGHGSYVAEVTGSVFGGGDAGNVVGTPVVNVIEKCNTVISTGVYGGGNAADVTATSVTISGGTIGDVFGGGNGEVAAANVTNTTSVAIHGGTISRVFAGGNTSGTIGTNSGVTIDHTSSCPQSIGEVYGGGNYAAGKAGTITISCGAENIGDVYGGANQADITNDIELNITGGQINNVFGGNNTSGSIAGGITVNINKSADCSSFSLNNVYGGGNLAQYTIPDGKALAVNILNGTVSQNVYGGGKGLASDHSKGQVTGAPVVTIGDNVNSHQAIVSGSVFGGGDAGNVSGTPVVSVVEKCNTQITTAVYGGGNAADVTGTNVTINGGTIGDVFGGGNGQVAAANVTYSTSLAIHGGTITRVFAGGNTSGTIGTNSGVTIDHASSCSQSIDEVYGGGNYAAGKAGTITISCGAENIGDVYGGANQADITNDIELNITGGQINNVFGGNNTSGSIAGGITVNINKSADCSSFSLNNVYGGGNLAQYTIPDGKALAVNILNGTVSQNVYGGGKGLATDHEKGQVTGNPVVTIGDATQLSNNNVVAAVTGDVYGGGDAGNVVGTPQVNVINKCNTVISGDVYGGGNAADVGGTDVNIDGGTISGMVFGGGHGDKNANPQKEANVGGDVAVDITGGTINKVFGGSNSKGNISGTVAVTINKGATSCPMHITEVYGGGNVAAGNAGTLNILCTGTAEEGIGDVYGGANAADVNTGIVLNIKGGKINNVFGGNNASGAISGVIQVNVEWTGDCGVKSLGNVYGGGNMAPYTGTPTVNIKNGTVSQNVYGGGKGADAVVTGDPVVNIGDANAGYSAIVTGNVFGGGDAAAVTGSTSVTYDDENVSSNVGQLFGGGNAAGVSGATTVTLTHGKVNTGIYGGCNTSGEVGDKITVNVNGGTIGDHEVNLIAPSYTTADVFGGGYGEGTSTSGDVEVNIGGGTIYGDVYGGSALGSVNEDGGNTTTVNVTNGTLKTNAVQGETENHQIYYTYYGGNVFGGGLGQNGDATKGIVNGKIIVNIGAPAGDVATTQEHSGSATIKGSVYGCNNTNGSPKDNVTVNIYGTAHSGTNVVDYTGNDATYALNNVFGGGNNASYTTEGKIMSVNIYGCMNTIKRTFGGGNAAATKSVSTMIQGGRIDEAYGGGNGERGTSYPADVNGTVTLAIHGGNILHTFAGSNQNGTITGGSTVTVDNVGPCSGSQIIDELFCGGNFADVVGNIDATITCTEGMKVNRLYGGCKQADVKDNPNTQANEGNVHLTVKGGTFHYIYGGSQGTDEDGADIDGNVTLDIFGCTLDNTTFGDSDTPAIFGGSHVNGSIGGKITVNIEEKVGEGYCGLDAELADVYGGGNEAAYPGPNTNPSTTPGDIEVNIKHAKVKNVYGGGLGLSAAVTASPKVNIGDTDANHRAVVLENVYGGGNEAAVTGDTRILLQNRAKVHGNVYGGGNEAPVNGDTKVIVNGVSGN